MKQMKDSGIEWIGQIPEEWNIWPTKRFFRHTKTLAGEQVDSYERLALTMNGVIKRSKDDSEGLQPEKFDTYQVLCENELVFKLIDLANVKTSRVGLSPYTGIVSPAYIILTNDNEDNRFYYYYFMSMYYNEIFNNLGDNGVRSSLNAQDLLNIPMVDIPSSLQKRIADFLDEKCGKIDRYIEKQQKIIDKLKEYKQAVITEAVTKGLDPDAPMKDSGIEWIGMIPEHWSSRRLRYLGTCVNGIRVANISAVDIRLLVMVMYTKIWNCRHLLLAWLKQQKMNVNGILLKKGMFSLQELRKRLRKWH